MRRRISIASVVLAVAVMLVAMSVPHHHHGAAMCTAGEAISLSHTEHRPCSPQEHRDSHCVAESEYTSQRDDSAAAVTPKASIATPEIHTYICSCVECHALVLKTTRVSAPRSVSESDTSVFITTQVLRGPPCAC